MERPYSGTLVALERADDAHERRMKERLEWANRSEERRLNRLKTYVVSEEIQNLGQNQAALVEKMIQDLFALTPEWEIRRMKARAVSIRFLLPIAAHDHPHGSTKPVALLREHISLVCVANKKARSELTRSVYHHIFLFLLYPPTIFSAAPLWGTQHQHTVMDARMRTVDCRISRFLPRPSFTRSTFLSFGSSSFPGFL